MASGSGSDVMGYRDPYWKYYTPVEGNKNGTICNYYGLTIKSGGITCFKFHLSHINHNSNIKKGPNVPSKVKQKIRRFVKEQNKAKTKKVVDIEEIQTKLRDTKGGKYKHVIDEEDGENNEEEEDDDDDDDVYMYLANMHLDQRHAYRAAVQASKASEWNQQQE